MVRCIAAPAVIKSIVSVDYGADSFFIIAIHSKCHHEQEEGWQWCVIFLGSLTKLENLEKKLSPVKWLMYKLVRGMSLCVLMRGD